MSAIITPTTVGQHWGGPYSWEPGAYPMRGNAVWSEGPRPAEEEDPHLCSTEDVTGRDIQAQDGEIRSPYTAPSCSLQLSDLVERLVPTACRTRVDIDEDSDYNPLVATFR